MKVQVLQENLSKAVSFASHFASPKAQLPVLGNILLKASKTKLAVASTNLETSVSISVGAKIEKEGEITVPSKVINELISNLKPGTIELVVDKERLKIESQGFTSDISGMNANDFPSVPSLIDGKNAISLKRETFIESLSQVLFATSIDETRPLLTGVLLMIDKRQMILVATDGFRLSKKVLSIETSQKPFKLILPKGILNELVRGSGEKEELLFSFNEKENQAVFGIEDAVLSSRIIEGEFPDFEKIIPKSFLYKVFLDREELLRAVKLASVFAREGANIVKLSLGNNFIEVLAESSTSGSQKTKVDARVEKKETKNNFEIAFNFRFLEEFLQCIAHDEICIQFSSDTNPGVFTDPKDENFLHLIMPVRIQT